MAMAWCDMQDGVGYTVGFARNSRIQDMQEVKDAVARAQEDCGPKIRDASREHAEFLYRVGSWDRSRRVACRIHCNRCLDSKMGELVASYNCRFPKLALGGRGPVTAGLAGTAACLNPRPPPYGRRPMAFSTAACSPRSTPCRFSGWGCLALDAVHLQWGQEILHPAVTLDPVAAAAQELEVLLLVESAARARDDAVDPRLRSSKCLPQSAQCPPCSP